MKYSIKIHLNKEIKAKVNPYFPLEFTEFIQILENLLSKLSEKRECVKKFDDQFLAKTDKYLPNFYIINLKAPSSHIWYSIYTRQGFHLGLQPILNPLLILCY